MKRRLMGKQYDYYTKKYLLILKTKIMLVLSMHSNLPKTMSVLSIEIEIQRKERRAIGR